MTVDPVRVRMRPPHPGRFIREEILETLDLSVTDAARALGVRRATLSNLVNAGSALSPEMALRMEKVFGLSMETLLNMQAWFDACAMRDKWDDIEVAPYATLPPRAAE